MTTDSWEPQERTLNMSALAKQPNAPAAPATVRLPSLDEALMFATARCIQSPKI